MRRHSWQTSHRIDQRPGELIRQSWQDDCRQEEGKEVDRSLERSCEDEKMVRLVHCPRAMDALPGLLAWRISVKDLRHSRTTLTLYQVPLYAGTRWAQLTNLEIQLPRGHPLMAMRIGTVLNFGEGLRLATQRGALTLPA